MNTFIIISFLLIGFISASYVAPINIHTAYTGDPTSLIITWHTTVFTPTSCYMNNHLYNGESNTYHISAGYDHYVTVSGLKPDTNYTYVVGSNVTGFSSPASIKTQKPIGSTDSFSVAMYGDMGINNCFLNAKWVSQSNVDFVYHVGDFAYGDDRPADMYEDSWNIFFALNYPTMLRVPYMTTVGNHEYSCKHKMCDNYTKGFVPYNSKFLMPGAFNQSRGMWYSWDYNNVHFITISTETDYDGAPYSTTFGDQLDWLESDLKTVNRSLTNWIIVTGHRPIYSSASGYNKNGLPHGQSESIQKAFEPLFNKYGVNLYVCGHVHAYERTFPVYQGSVKGTYSNPGATTYLIPGSMGNIEGLDTDWGSSTKWSAFRYSDDYGYGILNMNKNITWEWYRATNNQLVDKFVLSQF